MPYNKSSLPTPPDFPASNASYNKLVGGMHKAAMNAGTAEAAIAAVTLIKNNVGGVNTYAKATRRYGDKLIEVIGTNVADAIALAGKPAKAKGKAAMLATEVEKAAAEGHPVAEFMLKGAKAAKAVKAATPKAPAKKAPAKKIKRGAVA